MLAVGIEFVVKNNKSYSNHNSSVMTYTAVPVVKNNKSYSNHNILPYAVKKSKVVKNNKSYSNHNPTRLTLQP